MYTKIIFNIFSIILLAIIQVAFVSGLPGWFSNLNLSLVILIFILSLGDLKTALWWAIGLGLLFDIFSFSTFGASLAGLSITLVATNILLVSFFTNRSLYSFIALTTFSTVVYSFVLNIILYFINIIGVNAEFFIFNFNFWTNLFFQIVLNLIAVIFIFYFINFFTNKLKPAFLHKKLYK